MTKPVFILFVFLMTITGCASKAPRPEGGQTEPIYPLVGSLKVHRFVLNNGLRLLVVENHSSPTFAYQTWFRVGSSDETPGKTGLAHLFEHMMFKQTKHLKDGEFDRILESNGAHGENAFTDRDSTVYVQELPKEKLDLIAGLEAERMVNLVVNDAAFKTETEVVQNERRFRQENNPAGQMYQELFSLAFTKHSYRWPVIGYQEDLDAMSAKDAVEFYRTHYGPNHATIVVVGDVYANQTRAIIERHYGKLHAQPLPARNIEAEPPQEIPRRKQLKLNVQVERLLMGYHVPGITHEDIPALILLQTILSGGNSSRLNRALVETGIASSVYAYCADDQDPTLFMIVASLQTGKRAAHAESLILRELARLTSQPVPDAEIERARNRIEFEFFEGLDSNSEAAVFLGKYESITGDFRNGLKQRARIHALTAKDLVEVAKKYLNPKNRTVIAGVLK